MRQVWTPMVQGGDDTSGRSPAADDWRDPDDGKPGTEGGSLLRHVGPRTRADAPVPEATRVLREARAARRAAALKAGRQSNALPAKGL